MARGASRSATIDQVLNNARKIAEEGTKEIVLTGVNIGDFGLDNEGKRKASFLDLIQELDQIDQIERIRISSIEPNLCSNEIIDFVAGSKRFMPHFHMPLQSGSDKILGMMRRRYKRHIYTERVQRIKEVMPHCCIGVDVIVGFPGELEEDFLETFTYLSALDVSYLHVFTYSERPKTPAYDMPNKVAMGIRKQRNQQLRQLSARKRRSFYEGGQGEIRPVLVEQANGKDYLTGFTDNYIKVKIETQNIAVNSTGLFKIGETAQSDPLLMNSELVSYTQ